MNIAARFALIGLVSSTAWAAGEMYSPHKFQQNDWFAEFGQGGAQYVNPGMMTEIDQIEGSLALFRTINYQAGQEYLQLAVPYGAKSTFGFTAFSNGATIESGESYTENAYMFGYAYRPYFHHLSLGANLNLLQINQFGERQQITPGIDVGMTWNPVSNSRYGSILAGVAVQNLLQPVVSTSSADKDMKFMMQYVSDEKEYYAIPMNVNLSLFWRGNLFGYKNAEFKAEGSFIDVKHVDSEGGLDDPLQKFQTSFSALYYLNYMLGLKARFTKDGYPVIGATVNMKDLNVFKYLQWDLEMSHDDIRPDSKNRGFLLSSKLTTRVGPTREENLGSDNYERLKLEPERDYKRAMALYMQRNFLEASYAFGKIITKYPYFHLVDQAALYKGKAFENLQMHRAARETYKEAVRKYEASDRVADYKLRMMSIDYKEGKFDEALTKYQEILSKYKDSDVKPDADYIAGQIRFNQGQFDQAIALLQPILPGNANYLYSRYTIGIAYSRKGDMEKAARAFQDILDVKSANRSESDIQNASRVKLAHIYFSMPNPKLVEAANLYRAVPKDSYIYDEALLGVAWTLLKGNQADKAIQVADAITKAMPNSFMVPEAWLVKGYGLYIKKDLNGSRDALEKCKSMIERPVISEAQKDSANAKYRSGINNFEQVQDTVFNLARLLPTERVRAKREDPKLKQSFSQAMATVEDYTTFLKRMEESKQFEENRKRLISDANYTLAIIQNKLGGGTAPKKPGGGSNTGNGGLEDL